MYDEPLGWGVRYSQTNPHDILFELEAPALFEGQNLLAQGILMAEKMLLAVESSLTLGHTTWKGALQEWARSMMIAVNAEKNSYTSHYILIKVCVVPYFFGVYIYTYANGLIICIPISVSECLNQLI